MNILSQLREGRSAEDLCKEFAEEMNKAIADYNTEVKAKEEVERKAAEEKARAEVLEEQKTALLEEIAAKCYEYAQLAHPSLAEAWGETPIDELTDTLRKSFCASERLNEALTDLPNISEFFKDFGALEW